MCILLACGFALIALSQHQPLKARAGTPLFCCFAYIACETATFLLWKLNTAALAPSFCNYATFLAAGPQLTAYLFSILNFGRFILINNLNNFKQRFWNVKDGQVRPKWYFTLLLRVSNGYGIAIISILIMAGTYLIVIIGGIIWKFDCQTTYSFFQLAIGYLYLIVMALFFIGLIILDLCLNWRKFFFLTDPFLFRLEKSTFPLYLLVILLSASLNNPVFGTEFTPPLANTVVQTMVFHWIIFFDIYFILIATVITILRDRSRKSQNNEKSVMAGILGNEEVRMMFLEHAKNEWSVENVLIHDDIMSFQKMNEKDREEQAILILNKYLSHRQSIMEVNVQIPSQIQ